MKRFLILYLLIFSCFFMPKIYGQTNASAAADCLNAIRICEPIYNITTIAADAGSITDEIQDDATCLFDEDERAITWYTFTTNSAGELAFLITPNNLDTDIDWALFDLTNASCDDLRHDPLALMVSCNAAGGDDCHGVTGMSSNGYYEIQGAGCYNDPPNIDSGNNPINATTTVDAGRTYVLAVQNWTYLDSGNPFQNYTIDFNASTADIFGITPQIINIETGTTCDNIHIQLNTPIACDNIDDIQIHLLSLDGSMLIETNIFAPDCLRGANRVSDFYLTSVELRNAAAGFYILVIEDNPINEAALSDACGNSMALPVALIVELKQDSSLDVNIINRRPNANICAGEMVELDADVFPPDFFGYNLYTWTLPDGSTFIGQEIETNQVGTYYVEVLQNGNTSNPGCKKGFAEYTLGLCVEVSVKVLLQGPYDHTNGTMQAMLHDLLLLPTSQAGYTIESGILTITGDDAIVDWVTLELRSNSDATSVLATRPALLQADGDVVDMDGSSAVGFVGVDVDSAYVVVKHRNHLGVMTALPVVFD